jgi:hypothetical protein
LLYERGFFSIPILWRRELGATSEDQKLLPSFNFLLILYWEPATNRGDMFPMSEWATPMIGVVRCYLASRTVDSIAAMLSVIETRQGERPLTSMDMVRADWDSFDSPSIRMSGTNIIRVNGGNHEYNFFHLPTIGATNMLIADNQSTGRNSSFVKLLYNVATIIDIGSMPFSSIFFEMLTASSSVTLSTLVFTLALTV